jgi:hypothetical protein
LNVAESWNYGNSVIFYGNGGDIPGNKRDQQELSVLCLRALQASIGYLNTLMIQDVLDERLVALTVEERARPQPVVLVEHLAVRRGETRHAAADLAGGRPRGCHTRRRRFQQLKPPDTTERAR